MIDQSQFEHKKVSFYTLGCKLNFSESSSIGRSLSEVGFERVRFGEKADLVVINTCSVTDLADKKCRQAIRKTVKRNPGAMVVVTGCYAQLKPDDIASIEGVDLVLGANEKFKLLEYIDGNFKKWDHSEVFRSELKNVKDFYPSYSYSDRTRCFLKVQDGCDYFCSYCTIPLARGKSRSGSVKETVELAKKAIDEGAKELILTGVNVGDFGKGSDEKFIDLLKALDALKDIERIRIGSVEPELLTDEIIELVSQSCVLLPHFHLPLQSGSDEVLRIMRRHYDTKLFRERVEKIKTLMPDAFIGIDVIVGVNGETASAFDETHAFLKNLPFSQLHVFTYSERPNTKALKIEPKVTPEQKRERSQALLNMSERKTKAFYLEHRNQHRRVLWEAQELEGHMFGFTDNYIKMMRNFDKNRINQIEEVTLADINIEHNALNIME